MISTLQFCAVYREKESEKVGKLESERVRGTRAFTLSHSFAPSGW